jgi:hypothetical protein
MIVVQAFLHWVNIPIKRFSTLHGFERTKNDRGSGFSTLDKHKDPTFFGFAWPDKLKNDDDSDFSTLDKHKDSTFFGFARLNMQKIDGDTAFSTLDKPKSLAPPRLAGQEKQDNYMDWFRLSVVIRINYVFFVLSGVHWVLKGSGRVVCILMQDYNNGEELPLRNSPFFLKRRMTISESRLIRT